VRFYRAVGQRAAGNSPLATKELSVKRSKQEASRLGQSFPKHFRILRSSEFRRVYQEGFRFSSPFFSAFCRRAAGQDGSRIGFTAPRALGKAVVRNRIKRRIREAVRLHLSKLPPGWEIVLNPRRTVLDAEFAQLELEIERLFSRCKAS